MPTTTATVFSWDLRINNESVTAPFSGLKYSYSVSGFGVSGIATGQFDFDIYDEGNYYGTAMLSGATAELAGIIGKFYISKRSVSKHVCHFTAYDFVADTSDAFDPSGVFQSATLDYVTSGSVLNSLSSQMGVPLSCADAEDLNMQMTCDSLSGQSYGGVMEMIAASACGIWCTDGDGGMILVDLNKNIDEYTFFGSSEEHAEIDYQGIQQIGKLVHANSETGNIEEHGGSTGSVISVENPIVARGNGWGSKVWERIGNYQYQAWKCEKALMLSVSKRPICSVVELSGVKLITGNFTLDVDSTGIYFSGGRDPQSDERWGYEDKLTRTKIGINKSVGNTTITSSGRIEFCNKNKKEA